MNLDEELRGTLVARADEAPSGAGTLEAVRLRTHRLDVRRRVAVVGAVALAVLAVATGTTYVANSFGRAPSGISDSGPSPTATEPSPTVTTSSPTPSASPTRASTVALAAPDFAPLRFPLTPSSVPAGLGTPVVGTSGGEIRIWYGEDTPRFLMATVAAEKPVPAFEPSESQPTTVGGRPATRTHGTDADGKPSEGLIWQLSDGRWVDVSGTGLTAAEVRSFAEGLQDQPMPPPPLPFTFALAPRGYEVAFQEIHPAEYHLCLAPPADVDNQGAETWLCFARNTQSAPAGGDPVQVGPDPGQIVHDSGLSTLTVRRPGFEFSVVVSDDGPISQADLIRFAAGISKR